MSYPTNFAASDQEILSRGQYPKGQVITMSWLTYLYGISQAQAGQLLIEIVQLGMARQLGRHEWAVSEEGLQWLSQQLQ